MTTTYDVDSGKLVSAIAEELRKTENIQPPEWAAFVKTGTHAERMPDDPDWWYMRCASILRKAYLKPVGVSRLRAVYGGAKNRGYKPERFTRASGNIIRKGFQQLEEAGLVKKGKKGREITPAGRKLLDNTAHKIATESTEK